jgi:aminoglycoside phosphotransferase (APT) family kinase protein
VESLTKRRVSTDELAAMVRRGFGEQAQVVSRSELAEGSYNAVYLVTVAEPNTEVVLKVAPDPGLRLLTYEVDLMRTEVEFYRRAVSAGVPVPEVIFADFGRCLLGTDYVFLSRIPGVPLNTIREQMSKTELVALRAGLAGVTARLHALTGSGFGYPLRASHTWKSTWRGAFGLMVDDLLADAVRLKSELPAPPQRIEALIRRHDDVLDQVERPALVHFDLWDGNVFVTPRGDGRWRITGLIDGERAFFGDPVAELVSLALYRDVTDQPELLSGYAAGSAVAPSWLTAAEHLPIQLADGARRRLALYAIYLYLTMSIEGVTRGFEGPGYDALRRRVLDMLELWLGELGRRASE